MTKVQKIGVWAAISIAVAALTLALYAGFAAGGYWTAQKYEKAAVAHFCGAFDPETLDFVWRVQVDVRMTEEAMDGAPVLKSQKGGS